MAKPRIQVDLKLTGHFEPAELADFITLTPTGTWRAGEPVQSTRLRRKSDGWIFGIPQREDYDANAILCELLDKIEPHRDEIMKAVRRFGLETDISFGIYLRDESPACWFSADTIERVSKLGANLDVDLILTL